MVVAGFDVPAADKKPAVGNEPRTGMDSVAVGMLVLLASDRATDAFVTASTI
jgi:hypothetical protein